MFYLQEKPMFEETFTRESIGTIQSEQKTPPMKFDASPGTFYRNFRDKKHGTKYTHFKLHIYFKRPKHFYQDTLHTKIK